MQAHVDPDAAPKCVWMTAGMVTYKLCDRELRCDGCPLDAELRHAVATSTGAQRPAADDPMTVDASGGLLFFARNHVWVRVERSDAVMVGLDDFMLRLLAKVTRCFLPARGAVVVKGDGMAIVVCGEISFVVDSPISGRVVKRNAELLRHPAVALDQPAAKSWLLHFDPANLFGEMNLLLTGRRALAWQREEIAKLEVFLGTLPRQQLAQLGPLMGDGKARLDTLSPAVGPESYYRIVNSFLHPEE
jgi:glycine cleavage system H lipoate-binding protein